MGTGPEEPTAPGSGAADELPPRVLRPSAASHAAAEGSVSQDRRHGRHHRLRPALAAFGHSRALLAARRREPHSADREVAPREAGGAARAQPTGNLRPVLMGDGKWRRGGALYSARPARSFCREWLAPGIRTAAAQAHEPVGSEAHAAHHEEQTVLGEHCFAQPDWITLHAVGGRRTCRYPPSTLVVCPTKVLL